MLAAAKTVTETPLDTASMATCRNRVDDVFTVYVGTVRVPQADGSERWQTLDCVSDYRRKQPWECRQNGESHVISVVTRAGGRPVQVVIPNDMDGALARRHVDAAFFLLGRHGVAASCGDIKGMKTLPPFTDVPPGVVKDFSSLGAELREGDGELALELDPDGFAISRNLRNVHFVFGSPDGAPQVRCWSQSVVLVTS